MLRLKCAQLNDLLLFICCTLRYVQPSCNQVDVGVEPQIITASKPQIVDLKQALNFCETSEFDENSSKVSKLNAGIKNIDSCRFTPNT